MRNKFIVGSVALVVVILGVYMMQNKHHEDIINDESRVEETTSIDPSQFRSQGSRHGKNGKKSQPVDINSRAQEETASVAKSRPAKKSLTSGAPILTGDQTVDGIVKNIGLQDHLQGIEKSLEEMMESMMELSGNLDEKELEKIREVLGENFAAEKLLEEYRTDMRAQFSDDEMVELSKLYSDDAIMEGKRLEQQANEEANKSVDDVMAFVGDLRKNPLSPERKALLERVDSALKTTDLASRVMSVEEGEADPATIGMVSEGVQAQMAYTYRDLDDKSLANYVEKIESPLAVKERSVYNNIVVSSMKKTHTTLEENVPSLNGEPSASTSKP